MTYDELVERTVQLMRDLHDLKEDVLFSGGVQPDFDAGMLEAAHAILRANVDDEDPRVVAETTRQCNSRLLRVLNQPPSINAVDPVPGVVAEVRRATDDSSSLPSSDERSNTHPIETKGLPSAASHPARTEERKS